MVFNKIIVFKCIIIIITLITAFEAALEQVDDTDLVHLLTGEDNVVALFTKSNCQECLEYESIVENLQKDMKETLGAVVVKAYNSHMISIYDPSREPALIYFRRGIPLLYYGDLNEEEIMQTFSENRDPVVKELSDENFEHLTQAATGATTGDWFVFFYSADCVFCQRLYAVWEAVGAKLQRRLNVARVNRLEAGISTAHRFGITKSPEFIFLRQGKLYRYNVKDYTPKSFIEFVESGYRKQTHPELVPDVPNVMDGLYSNFFQVLIGKPTFVMLTTITLSFTVLMLFIFKCLVRKTPTPLKERKSKKTK